MFLIKKNLRSNYCNSRKALV